MKRLITIIMLLMLVGCATPYSASSGTSGYTYERITKDGEKCKVTIASARDALGANIRIGKSCDLEANADLTGVEQQRLMLQSMQQMLLLMQPVITQYLQQPK